MGTSRTALELGHKLNAAGDALVRANVTVVTRAALKVKLAAEAERTKVTGGDGRLSNVGRRGSRLGVASTVTPSGPSAIVRATGPWQIVENDTRAHRITSKYAGSTRARRSLTGVSGPQLPGSVRGGRRAVVLTPFGYRRYVRHPGTHGKHPWRKAMTVSTRNLSNEVATPIRDALAAVFR